MNMQILWNEERTFQIITDLLNGQQVIYHVSMSERSLWAGWCVVYVSYNNACTYDVCMCVGGAMTFSPLCAVCNSFSCVAT